MRREHRIGYGAQWVIWSNERSAWWGPDSGGYSTSLLTAGVYTEAAAMAEHERSRRKAYADRRTDDAIPLTVALRRESSGSNDRVIDHVLSALSRSVPLSGASDPEIAEARKIIEDMRLAAGELLIPIPEPGTTMSRLLSANVLLRRERDEARSGASDTTSEAER